MASDYVYPKIGNRDTIEVWEEKGQPDIRETAKRRAHEVLGSHFPRHIDEPTDKLIRTRFDIRLPRDRMHRPD